LTEDIIDTVSRVIDEMSLRFLALRSGKLILSRDLLPAENLLEVLRDVCRGKTCLARITTDNVEGSLLIYGGGVIAAYSKVGNVESSGRTSLKELLARLNVGGGKISAYEIPLEELISRYPELTRLIEESSRARPPVEVPTPTPPKEVPKEAPKIPPVEAPTPTPPREVPKISKDLGGELIDLIGELNLPVSSASIDIEKDRAVVRASWTGAQRYPLSLVLAAVKVLSGRGLYVRRIELVSESRATLPTIFPVGPRVTLNFDSPDAMKVVATVAEICLKKGFYVEDIDYKLRRGSLSMKLEVIVPHNRIADLNPEMYWRIPRELAEEVRKKLLEMLGGKVEIKVLAMISTLQGYLEYEGKAP